eukprot:TRINITY_DN4249_c0_g1_i1.p1 TRINITY_DN4249_c0_g1~~TRINITY_DN4249_c0_g1_i1.p1  ORF type:complete len:559 (+),score=111.67 TRINITY_DN4249_c0_g1_i1:2713-4389(+)
MSVDPVDKLFDLFDQERIHHHFPYFNNKRNQVLCTYLGKTLLIKALESRRGSSFFHASSDPMEVAKCLVWGLRDDEEKQASYHFIERVWFDGLKFPVEMLRLALPCVLGGANFPNRILKLVLRSCWEQDFAWTVLAECLSSNQVLQHLELRDVYIPPGKDITSLEAFATSIRKSALLSIAFIYIEAGASETRMLMEACMSYPDLRTKFEILWTERLEQEEVLTETMPNRNSLALFIVRNAVHRCLSTSVVQFKQIISQSRSLKEFGLPSCRLDGEYLVELLESVKCSASLQKLNFSRLQSTKLKIDFSEYLPMQLKILDLAGVKHVNPLIEFIGKSSSMKLQALLLERCGIDLQGAAHLENLLKNNSTITYLSLIGNDSSILTGVATAIGECSSLLFVSFTENTETDSKPFWVALALSLNGTSNSNLQYLKLTGCNVQKTKLFGFLSDLANSGIRSLVKISLGRLWKAELFSKVMSRLIQSLGICFVDKESSKWFDSPGLSVNTAVAIEQIKLSLCYWLNSKANPTLYDPAAGHHHQIWKYCLSWQDITGDEQHLLEV